MGGGLRLVGFRRGWRMHAHPRTQKSVSGNALLRLNGAGGMRGPPEPYMRAIKQPRLGLEAKRWGSGVSGGGNHGGGKRNTIAHERVQRNVLSFAI